MSSKSSLRPRNTRRHVAKNAHPQSIQRHTRQVDRHDGTQPTPLQRADFHTQADTCLQIATTAIQFARDHWPRWDCSTSYDELFDAISDELSSLRGRRS